LSWLAAKSFLMGGVAIGSIAAALFFWRFWRMTADRFFLYFALSFGVEAVDRTILGLSTPSQEHEPLLYLLRLVSYGLILVAIVDKNRTQTQRK
jgi:hypothetical protein